MVASLLPFCSYAFLQMEKLLKFAEFSFLFSTFSLPQLNLMELLQNTMPITTKHRLSRILVMSLKCNAPLQIEKNVNFVFFR